MRKKIVLFVATAVLLGGAALFLTMQSPTPVEAGFCDPGCAPCVVGGTCDCSTRIIDLDNARCKRPEGGWGDQIVIRTCVSCPPSGGCTGLGCDDDQYGDVFQGCTSRTTTTCR